MLRKTPLRAYTNRCEQCGQMYHPEKRSQRFCSQRCVGLARTLPRPVCPVCGRQRRDRGHSDRAHCSRACAAVSATKPRRICDVCGERPVVLGQKTCGPSCGYKARKLATRRPRACPSCGKGFMPYPSALSRGAGKFCSRACYDVVLALRPAFVEAICTTCGTSFRRTAAALARIKRGPFCSIKCRAASMTGTGSPSWRGNRRNYRGPRWQEIAETVRERDGRRCRRCGKAEADEPRRLSVDHVIPFRTFETADEANRLENLVALCGSCHSKKLGVETRWLRGDVLDMWHYQVAVSERWTR